jgi:hypothetical protein
MVYAIQENNHDRGRDEAFYLDGKPKDLQLFKRRVIALALATVNTQSFQLDNGGTSLIEDISSRHNAISSKSENDFFTVLHNEVALRSRRMGMLLTRASEGYLNATAVSSEMEVLDEYGGELINGQDLVFLTPKGYVATLGEDHSLSPDLHVGRDYMEEELGKDSAAVGHAYRLELEHWVYSYDLADHGRKLQAFEETVTLGRLAMPEGTFEAVLAVNI